MHLLSQIRCICAYRYTKTTAPGDAPAEQRAHTASPPAAPAAPVPGRGFGHGCDPFEPAEWPFALRGADATAVFRSRAFRAARLPQPPLLDSRRPLPKQITLLSAAGGEAVVNHVRPLLCCACSASAGPAVRGCCGRLPV